MIDQDLVAHIAGLATAAGSRVHIGNAPQGTDWPFVVIQRTGGRTPLTLSGASLFSRGQFAVNVFAREYADAYPIANAIKASLHGYTGVMGMTTIRSSRCTNEPADSSAVDGDKVVRWLAMDFLIVY